MAFFDKLENFARNIGDKTSDAIETNKLNSKISSEKSLAAEEWKKIGEFYYNIYINGGEVAPEVLEACDAAKAHLDAAAEAQAKIEQIKAEKEAQAQAAAEARAAQEAAMQAEEAGAMKCPECGAEVPEGRKFCSECGTKIEVLKPAPVANVCPNCGAPIAEGKKFCGECGTKIELPTPPEPEIPKPKFCSGCGAELPEGRKFCGECGTKVE